MPATARYLGRYHWDMRPWYRRLWQRFFPLKVMPLRVVSIDREKGTITVDHASDD